MKAALLVEPGAHRHRRRARAASRAPEDVRIAVGGVGLCGSDLAVFRGKWTAPRYPWVRATRPSAASRRSASGSRSARIGEVVVIEPNIACRACPECDRGRTSACRARQSVGMNRPGALAEKVVRAGRPGLAGRAPRAPGPRLRRALHRLGDGAASPSGRPAPRSARHRRGSAGAADVPRPPAAGRRRARRGREQRPDGLRGGPPRRRRARPRRRPVLRAHRGHHRAARGGRRSRPPQRDRRHHHRDRPRGEAASSWPPRPSSDASSSCAGR